MVAIANHVEIPVSECIKAVAKDAWIEKFILAEYIYGFVGYNRSCQQEPIPGKQAQSVHSF
jgi:hypothetical protein